MEKWSIQSHFVDDRDSVSLKYVFQHCKVQSCIIVQANFQDLVSISSIVRTWTHLAVKHKIRVCLRFDRYEWSVT